MRHVLPSIDDVADYAARVSSRIGLDRVGSAEHGIQVRRFAGHLAHVDGLAHLRVAHLTDLHFGRVTPMAVQLEASRLVNLEKPDLVVITGDFVCHNQLFLDQLVEALSQIEAPIACVLGNHDHWSGSREVRHALRKAGAIVLDNSHTTLTLRGQRLQLVGVDDAYTGHADVERAVRGLRSDLPSIGLSHIAEEADAFWRNGIPLVLSGHTHAGQVTLAGLNELMLGHLGGHRYVHGLYGTRSNTCASRGAVYVGAGIGASFMPLRVGERGRREVAIFELGHEPGSLPEHHDEQASLPGRKPSQRKQLRRAKRVATNIRRRDRVTAKTAGRATRRSRLLRRY